jgi:hypothetical protein
MRARFFSAVVSLSIVAAALAPLAEAAGRWG